MDFRQQTIPDRSHIKIVLRGPTERVCVAQPSSDCPAPQCAPVEPVCCLSGKIMFDLTHFVQQGDSIKPQVVSHGTQMHLGLGSSSRQLELKPQDVQVCIALVVCNVYMLYV